MVMTMSLAMGNESEQNSPEIARTAIAAYSANMKSFARYKSAMTSRRGGADSLNAALTGTYAVERSCDSVVLVNNNYLRINTIGLKIKDALKDKKVSKDEQKAKADAIVRFPVTWCEQLTFLSNGQEDLSFQDDMATNVFGEDLRGTAPVPPSPFGVGLFNPRTRYSPDVMLSDSGQFHLTNEGFHTLDGRPVIRVKFTSEADRATWELDLDPARGHIPVRTIRVVRPAQSGSEGPLVSESRVVEIKDCGNGRF